MCPHKHDKPLDSHQTMCAAGELVNAILELQMAEKFQN